MKIGIDIGGSHIGIGLIEENKITAIKDKIFSKEDKQDIENTIVNAIQAMISELLTENSLVMENIKLIGIACPGTIQNGKIVKAGNLNIKNFEILNRLREIYNIPMQIRNDGKCAALAEKVYGGMKEYDDCVFMNVGTGIGGAVFMNGKLLEPKRYSGFELGHMVVEKNGITCSCGKKGCLERYASIKTLKIKITETLGMNSDISGQYLREELLIKDDQKVKEIIEEYLEYLKEGLCNLIDIFEPEIICFGGSFSYYEETELFKRLIEKLDEPNSTFNEGERPRIITADFKNDAGIIGATIEA